MSKAYRMKLLEAAAGNDSFIVGASTEGARFAATEIRGKEPLEVLRALANLRIAFEIIEQTVIAQISTVLAVSPDDLRHDLKVMAEIDCQPRTSEGLSSRVRLTERMPE